MIRRTRWTASPRSPPRPDPRICPNDCISGRHNESAASQSFIGGDPLIRVGRFGLRGAGTTLLQFIVGGSQGELGLTSPFAPFEQPNVDTVDPTCNAGGPTPNVTATRILTVRDMIRNIAPPMPDAALFENPPTDAAARTVQAGAVLFGLDLDAFRARMTSDDVDPSAFSDDTNHAIANDRKLGCASCHIPVFRTGVSPAEVGGAENLSNRWAPIFSDLLIHQNPEVPYYLRQQWSNVQPKNVIRRAAQPPRPAATPPYLIPRLIRSSGASTATSPITPWSPTSPASQRAANFARLPSWASARWGLRSATTRAST